MLFSQVKELRLLWPRPVNTGRAKTSLFGRSTRSGLTLFFVPARICLHWQIPARAVLEKASFCRVFGFTDKRSKTLQCMRPCGLRVKPGGHGPRSAALPAAAFCRLGLRAFAAGRPSRLRVPLRPVARFGRPPASARRSGSSAVRLRQGFALPGSRPPWPLAPGLRPPFLRLPGPRSLALAVLPRRAASVPGPAVAPAVPPSARAPAPPPAGAPVPSLRSAPPGGTFPAPRGVFAAPPCRLLALARLLRVRFLAPFRPPPGETQGSVNFKG